MTYVIYKQNVKKDCYSCGYLFKILTIVVMVITLLFGLILIFVLIFNIFVNTFCSFIHAFTSVDDFSVYFNSTDTSLVKYLNLCLGSNATGKLFDVINVSDFDGLQSTIQGIQDY